MGRTILSRYEYNGIRISLWSLFHMSTKMLMNELVFTKMKLKSQRKGVELAVSIFGSFVLWFGYLDRASLFSFLIIQYQESSFISKIFFSRNRIRENDLQNFSITNCLYFSPYSCWKNLPVSSKSIWDLVRNYGWKELEIYFKKNHRIFWWRQL